MCVGDFTVLYYGDVTVLKFVHSSAVYPSLVSESDVTATGRRGQQTKDDDDLWTPQGCLHVPTNIAIAISALV